MQSEVATCPTCLAPLSTPYCAHCGERRFDHHSLSLVHFFEHAFEAFAHFDGAIFRTFRALVAAPGSLTASYAAGNRKPYLAPVQLFLIANLIYFAAVSINGWNTLNTDLNTHLTWTAHAPLARRMVKEKLTARGIEVPDYRPAFNAKGQVQAKSLVILMVPLFALALAALRFRTSRAGFIEPGRYFSEHMVFSLHFYAFLLLYLAVSTSITSLILAALARSGTQPGPVTVDSAVSWITLACLWPYLTLALRRTDSTSWPGALFKGFILVGVAVLILQLYRFLLFLVTFYTTF